MSITPDFSSASHPDHPDAVSTAPAIGNFTQPVLPIDSPETFATVRAAVTDAFGAANVEAFLKSMTRGNMRIRDFSTVLDRGLLGTGIKTSYGTLSPNDQGQIRELYLASLEKVSPDLRKRFFKLYAYY